MCAAEACVWRTGQMRPEAFIYPPENRKMRALTLSKKETACLIRYWSRLTVRRSRWR